jgi:hypothetical protein
MDENKCMDCGLKDGINLELTQQIEDLKGNVEELQNSYNALEEQFNEYHDNSIEIVKLPDSEELYDNRKAAIEKEQMELIKGGKGGSDEMVKLTEKLANMEKNKKSIIGGGAQDWLNDRFNELTDKANLEAAFKVGCVDRVEVRWTIKPKDADDTWKAQLEVVCIGHLPGAQNMTNREPGKSGGTNEQAQNHTRKRGVWKDRAALYQSLSGTDSERIKQIAVLEGTQTGTIYQSIIRAVSEGELSRVE